MVDPAELVGDGPVLVLAPHPDDESLGCGALLAACWRRGIPAHVVCLTDGAASHPRTGADLRTIRIEELRRAITVLGGTPARDLICLDHPDSGLHHVDRRKLTAEVADLVDRLAARVLIAPSPLDPHCDHVTTAELAEDIHTLRPALTLMFYPIWSRWSGGGVAPAVPGTRRFRFEALEPAKARAIAAHASQRGQVIRDDPGGFVMPTGFAAMFAGEPELFDRREG